MASSENAGNGALDSTVPDETKRATDISSLLSRNSNTAKNNEVVEVKAANEAVADSFGSVKTCSDSSSIVVFPEPNTLEQDITDESLVKSQSSPLKRKNPQENQPQDNQESIEPNSVASGDVEASNLDSKRIKLDTTTKESNIESIETSDGKDIEQETTVSSSSSEAQLIHIDDKAESVESSSIIAPTESAKPQSDKTQSDKTQSDKMQPEKLTKRQEERLAKQKLREAEKAERDRKKEEERRQKVEEREKKESERKQKREAIEKEKQEKREQERLRREERRLKVEEEKKAKELEKKVKEKERRNKEDERKKAEELKERSQMKISNFFAVKPVKVDTVSKDASSSLKPDVISEKGDISSPMPQGSESIPKPDEYGSDFLPFFQKRNALLASNSQLTPDLLESSKETFDTGVAQTGDPSNFEDLFTSAPLKAPHLYTTSQQIVDALNSAQMTEAKLSQLVTNLPPVKYLQFYENAKPPYVGTWCSEKHSSTLMQPTQPLDTTVTGFDYNYDSDLDWQEGDEGDEEDIDDLDEGDEEEEDAEDDEMEDFVDNTETSKRGHVGPLQSVTIWNDGTHNDIFDQMKCEPLFVDIPFPIDPFKNYWATEKPSKQVKGANEGSATGDSKIGNEVKDSEKQEAEKQSVTQEKAVASITSLGALSSEKSSEKTQTPNVLTPQKPIIKDEQVVGNLTEFIKKNNDFSIGTLSELAKKEFKIYTKSMLKHTIQEIAFYNKKNSTWEIKQKSGAKA